MQAVVDASTIYDYVHLILSMDIPLMSKRYFKKTFSTDSYLGFSREITEADRRCIQWYYPIHHLNIRGRLRYNCIIRPIRFINWAFKVNRLSETNQFEKGANWFSLHYNLVSEVVAFPNLKMFLNSYLADEVYVQTILNRLKPEEDSLGDDDCTMAARYIDWEHGKPYTFGIGDLDELMSAKDTDFAFARKVTDPVVMDSLFK